MIYIQRPPAPSFLSDPHEKWMKETNEAISHYSTATTKSFKFEMYNEKAVKDELKKVFVKCAYCESNYGTVYDGDVEHFRPKGKVKEKTPQTPGYYWLANDWNNLFLACQHCNQRRRHVLFGEDKLEGYGKMDQFPLQAETSRVQKHTEDFLNEEPERLLINPCIDDPSKHLAYEDTEGVVIPLTDMGKKSVEIYVLQRPLLVQERKKKLLLLFQQVIRVKRELARLNNDNSHEQKDIFKSEWEILLDFGKPESEFAGMCRFFIKKFLEENDLV